MSLNWYEITEYNEKYDDNDKLIAFIITVSIGSIMTIFLIWGIIRFKRIRRLIIVKKRYPTVVFIEAVLAIILVQIQMPTQVFVQSLFSFIPIHIDFQLSRIIYGLYPVTAHGLIWLEACRLWLIYFKLNYLNSVDNSHWKNELNSNATKDNFYLQNRKTWGSMHWLWKRAIIAYIFAVVILASLYGTFSYNTLVAFIDGAFYCVPVLFVIILYVKCPKLEDKLYFHYEFRATTYLFCICLVLYLISTILYNIDKYPSIVAQSLVGSIAFCGTSLISTHMITSKILKIGGVWINIYHKGKTEDSMTSGSTSKYIEQQIDIEIVKQRSVSSPGTNTAKAFRDIFTNEENVDLFAQHLLEEYSIEVLLSYVEFIQYKSLFKEQYYSNHKTDNKLESYFFEIDVTKLKCIPESSIIYNSFNDNNIISNFKNMAWELFNKYVKKGVLYEINISSSLKRHYYHLFKMDMDSNINDCYNEWMNTDINPDDLYSIYDSCIHEMYKFLRDSSMRFWQSIQK